MTASSSDLIQLRMKLIGDKVVVSGTDRVSKSVKGLGKTTSETSRKTSLAATANSRLTSSYKKLGTAAKWGLGFLGVGGALAIENSRMFDALNRTYHDSMEALWGGEAR